MVGFAGTGKSYLLGAAREAWEAQGYRVLGATLAGKAAEGLESGSGIESRTLQSRWYSWAHGHDRLTAKDVLVVDEAGMLGSQQMAGWLICFGEQGANWCWWATRSSYRRFRQARRFGRFWSGLVL